MDARPDVPFDTTLEVRDACLCLHAQRAARALARRFDAALRPAGLTNTQFSMMMALNRPSAPTIGEVATLIGADRTTLTAALKPLARRGLVRIGPDPEDSRARRVALTAEGNARLAEAVGLWRRAHAALEASLGDVDSTQLRRGMTALAAPLPRSNTAL